ncbi:MAG: hypothetical protein AB1756_07120 [Acidobacteriota bacterium]
MTGIKMLVLFAALSLSLASSSPPPAFSQEVDASRILPELKSRMYSIQVKDQYAFAAVTAGLIIFDVAVPAEVKEAGTAYVHGSGTSVTLSGQNAILSAGPSGLWLFDISKPDSPVEVAHLKTPGAAMATAIAGKLCFVADGTFGLLAFDISDPRHPKEVFHHDISDTKDYYRHVVTAGDLVYAAAAFNGVKIFRIEGNRIDKISEFKTAGEARHLAVSGKELFVADGHGGLRIYDISKPEMPHELGSIPTRDFTRGLTVRGKLAYLADGNGGLRIIDVSKPGNPVEKGSIKTPASANGVTVSGNHAFVAADAAGLAVYDVSNPSAPVHFEKKKEEK